MSEDISHRSLTRARSQLIASSTPHNAFLQTHFEVSSPNSSSMTPSFAKRKGVSTANVINEESHSKNASSPESSLTNSSGPITRSRSASKASQSHSQPRLTPGSSSRYNLRARNSASSQSNANLASRQSEGTHRNSDPTPTHQYQTRSRTSSNKTKIKAPERCCAKLAVVVHRIRMSMIARLRCRRSSIRLPTPQETRLSTPKKRLQPRRLAVSKTRVEPRRLSTPKKRLQPRRLSLRKAKILARGKNSRLVSSARKR